MEQLNELLHLYDVDWYFQIPPEDGSMAAPVLESSPVSLLADPTRIIAQPISEQVTDATSKDKSPI